MSEHEYNNLIYEISEKIDATKLGKLVFICRYDLPKGCIKDSITTVLALFEELEKNNRLGIDRLDALKNILTLLKKRSLLQRVEEFEAKRKAQSFGIISSLKRAAESLVGANDLTEQERPDDRRRRTSDSFLHLGPKKDEVTLMRLKQAENKWNFKVQLLEKENEELKLAAVKEKEAWQIVHLERPEGSRRRNSDSNVYYKEKEEEVRREGEKEQDRFLEDEKYSFVQRYLENVRETHSFTTETESDSGIKTHGATSELGMEDIADSVRKLYYKDLTEEVTSKLRGRIEVDSYSAKLILQSLGIRSITNVADALKFFPNTPGNY